MSSLVLVSFFGIRYDETRMTAALRSTDLATEMLDSLIESLADRVAQRLQPSQQSGLALAVSIPQAAT